MTRKRPLVAIVVLFICAQVMAQSDIGDLKSQAKSSNYKEREKAAQELGKLEDAEVVPLLLVLLKDEWGDVRASAADSLGRCPDKRAVEPLCKSLFDRGNWLVQMYSARSLGLIGDAKAVTPLCKALRDPQPQVAWYSAKALSLIGDPKAIPALRVAAKSKDETLAKWSNEAIASIQAKKPKAASAKSNQAKPVLDALELALAKGDAKATETNIKKLLAMKEAAMPELVKAFEGNDPYGAGYNRRMGAYRVCHKLPGKIVLPYMVRLATSEYSNQREAAAFYIGRYGNKSHLSILQTLTKDRALMVRTFAEDSIKQINARGK